MAAVKKLVQFSVPELRDLLSHVRDNRNSGAYWARRKLLDSWKLEEQR